MTTTIRSLTVELLQEIFKQNEIMSLEEIGNAMIVSILEHTCKGEIPNVILFNIKD